MFAFFVKYYTLATALWLCGKTFHGYEKVGVLFGIRDEILLYLYSVWNGDHFLLAQIMEVLMGM